MSTCLPVGMKHNTENLLVLRVRMVRTTFEYGITVRIGTTMRRKQVYLDGLDG
jgi:hypothetical protein